MSHRVRWVGGSQFWAETESGHCLTMQGLPEEGEVSVAARPMELLLAGMGGCTGYDVLSILKKARQDVRGLVIELTAERAAEPPKVYTSIHVSYHVSGKGVKEAQVKRAVELSAEKYCSASVMLGQTAKITHSWVITEIEAPSAAEA